MHNLALVSKLSHPLMGEYGENGTGRGDLMIEVNPRKRLRSTTRYSEGCDELQIKVYKNLSDILTTIAF